MFSKVTRNVTFTYIILERQRKIFFPNEEDYDSKGPFTNTCKGGLMQKTKTKKNQRKKVSGPFFSPRKICVNPGR